MRNILSAVIVAGLLLGENGAALAALARTFSAGESAPKNQGGINAVNVSIAPANDGVAAPTPLGLRTGIPAAAFAGVLTGSDSLPALPAPASSPAATTRASTPLPENATGQGAASTMGSLRRVFFGPKTDAEQPTTRAFHDASARMFDNSLDAPHADALMIIAVDIKGERVYLAGRGDSFQRWNPAAKLPLDERAGKHPVFVFVYPTETYSEGMGGGRTDLAPEDRAMIRVVKQTSARVICAKVPPPENRGAALPGQVIRDSQKLIAFDPSLLARIREIFKSCITVPNRQDYIYLATKTFGLNLLVRVGFASQAVMSGQLPLMRAVLSTSWYQLQDTVFTLFGQTYMKFLGKMTGMLRVGRAYLGDLVFVYVQLCGLEFLNRLVLGPLGENPIVYTWHGLSLIFLNILQGMLSGGPLIPAINQMRRSGVISYSTMMHLYQLTSLTMQFGLFASFGYQSIYAILTGATLLLSWSSYLIFSTMFRDPEFAIVQDAATLKRLDSLARNRPPL